MATRPRPRVMEKPAPRGSGISQVLRVFWMLLGPGVMGYAAAYIIMDRPGIPSFADAVYWGSVVALLAARRLDIVRFGGATADGEPATLSHWRRYAILLAAVATALWVAAHAAATWLGS